MIDPNDASILVKKLKHGSSQAFSRLYVLYADLLYGFVLSLTKSPAESKDIVQETFLRIWMHREQLSLDMSFKSYLYTIARNQIIDSLRKELREEAFRCYMGCEDQQSEVVNSIENNIYYDEFVERLNKAKEKMTDRQRSIFELSKEYGRRIDSIAEELKLSEKTVKNMLTLAMKVVREELHYPLILLLFSLF